MLDKTFFLEPADAMQRRYEALRASCIDNLPTEEICKRFGYTVYSFKSLKRDSKELTAGDFFKLLKKGPKSPRKKTLLATKIIIRLRKKKMSVNKIQKELEEQGIQLSLNHISKISREHGFPRLFRSVKN